MSKLLAAAATVSIIVLSGSSALAASSSPSPAPSPNPSGSSATDAAGKPVVTFGIGPSKNKQVDRRPNYNMLSPKGGQVADEVAGAVAYAEAGTLESVDTLTRDVMTPVNS
jgi:hypothetical protein